MTNVYIYIYIYTSWYAKMCSICTISNVVNMSIVIVSVYFPSRTEIGLLLHLGTCHHHSHWSLSLIFEIVTISVQCNNRQILTML